MAKVREIRFVACFFCLQPHKLEESLGSFVAVIEFAFAQVASVRLLTIQKNCNMIEGVTEVREDGSTTTTHGGTPDTIQVLLAQVVTLKTESKCC